VDQPVKWGIGIGERLLRDWGIVGNPDRAAFSKKVQIFFKIFQNFSIFCAMTSGRSKTIGLGNKKGDDKYHLLEKFRTDN
jgi:hypothetical protein